MSLMTFRDKNSKGDPVGPVWYLQFDALTVEEFSRTAELTQYPIETGAVLSDHYQPQPKEITLQGVVSDTPSGPWTNLENKQNAAAPPVMAVRPLTLQVKPDQRLGSAGVPRPIVTGVLPSRRLVRGNIDRARLYIPKIAETLQVTNASNFTASGVTRVKSFMGVLDGLMETRTDVTVVLQGGQEYKNMMIVNHRAPRVSGSGGSVTFTIELQGVTLADPAQVTEGTPVPASPAHSPKKNAGRANGRPPSGTETSRFIKDVAPRIRAVGLS